jgi:biopolymer transport protein TolQ
MELWANLVLAAAETGGAERLDMFEVLRKSVAQGNWVVLGVLGLLVLFSLVSWYIIGYKWFYVRKAQNESIEFLETFWQSKRLDQIYQSSERLKRSPISMVFRAGYVELSKIKKAQASSDVESMATQLGEMENINRALRRAASSEVTHLESLVPFLATTASTAPFVGLFGTVWGIMNSFRDIAGQGAANLTTVAPGISEALIATAIGLAAAIPAVIAYNYFLSKIKVLSTEMDNFSNDFLNIVKRHFFK